MLIIGVMLGVMLGPACLGRFAPDLYDPLFLGSGDTTTLEQAQAELNTFLNDEEARTQIIEGVLKQFQAFTEEDMSMATARDEQLFEINNTFAEQHAQLQANVDTARIPILANQQAHRDKLLGMATMMLLIAVALFAAEAILSPQRDELEQGKATLPPILSRLITIRYGLAAGWLMIMLAQPVWLKGIDFIFGGLLLTIVLLAGLIPLGKSHDSAPGR